MEIKKPFIVNIYECVDRVAQGSDITLNEDQIKEFWGKAELVEHEAQKHPGDGNRMWEAVIEIEDLGLCLVTHTYSFVTMIACRSRETNNWLSFQENVGLEFTTDFIDPNGEFCEEVGVDRETDMLTCLFTPKDPEKQIKKMLKEIGDGSIKFKDLVLVKV